MVYSRALLIVWKLEYLHLLHITYMNIITHHLIRFKSRKEGL